jgi:hypothetical protein
MKKSTIDDLAALFVDADKGDGGAAGGKASALPRAR